MKKENLTISEIKNLIDNIISEKKAPKKELQDTYEKHKEDNPNDFKNLEENLKKGVRIILT